MHQPEARQECKQPLPASGLRVDGDDDVSERQPYHDQDQSANQGVARGRGMEWDALLRRPPPLR
jgi:hypothetical protein